MDLAKQTPVRCPECLTPRETGKRGSLFCCAEHRIAFNNRQTVRGRVLTTLVMAERITRSGSAGRWKFWGKAARQDSRRMMDKWAKEDREAGRMRMDEYLCLRWRLGFLTKIDL